MPVPKWRQERHKIPGIVYIEVLVNVPGWNGPAMFKHRYTIHGGDFTEAGRRNIENEIAYGAHKAVQVCLNRAAIAAFPEETT